MSSGIYSALSGAVGQERNLNVVANNIANVTTTGFKADAIAFNQALAAQAQPEPERNASLQYAELTRVEPDLSAGALRQTGKDLDFALLGEGFFTLRTPQGERLTRDGSFVRDAAGKVTTQAGDPVLVEGGKQEPEGRELIIPPQTKRISVDQDGTIRADGVDVGKLRVRTLVGAQEIQKIGRNQFTAAENAELARPDELGLVQGSLESANLNAIQGLTQMIIANRSFEALQKAIQMFRSLEERTARGLGQGA